MNDGRQDSRLAVLARRFPLTGRPRPSCPALPDRIAEIVRVVHAAPPDSGEAVSVASDALNRLALVASDIGLPDLATALCWRHADVYRAVPRPLAPVEGLHMVEPMVNLARIAIRDGGADTAVRRLEELHTAVTTGTDLIVDGRVIPTANIVRPARSLYGWVRFALISEGVRALCLAGRWADAEQLAERHSGIGAQPEEGRQAAIIRAAQDRDTGRVRRLLAETVPEYDWETEIVDCLRLMCDDPDDDLLSRTVTGYTGQRPAGPYASYAVRFGITVVLLAHPTRPALARLALRHAVGIAVTSNDGYAARDLVTAGDLPEPLFSADHDRLSAIHLAAGLHRGPIDEEMHARLSGAADLAATTLAAALSHRGFVDRS